jgi:FLVCR family feline leukemia virus subgroup C receptor-related protein
MWHYLMSSFDYICLTSSFGLIIGAANSAWATFLQALLYQAHPNDVQIGICGFLGLIAGMLGSVLWPYIAHKTKNYRLCLILMSFSVAVSLPIFCYFAYSPSFGFVEIDLITIFFNVHIGGMFSLVFEFAAEITFPISESFSSGIALASAQLLGFIIVETLTFSDASAYVISLTISILSVIGFLISCFVKNSLHRTEIESEKF